MRSVRIQDTMIQLHCVVILVANVSHHVHQTVTAEISVNLKVGCYIVVSFTIVPR